MLIFKHSTSCPTSAAAYNRFMKYAAEKGEALPRTYLVKVIESRPVSNAIAARLGVTHQSPQIILVKDEKALWSASHYGIHGQAIDDALAAISPPSA